MCLKKLLDRKNEYGPILVRWTVGIVFFLFGLGQVLDPNYFRGFLPNFLFSSPWATQIVLTNGGVEIILSLLLFWGFYTRIIATLLGLHLLGITIDVGFSSIGIAGTPFTDTGIRDLGLTLATFAVALYGPDRLCRDSKKKR